MLPEKVLNNLSDTFNYIADICSTYAQWNLRFPQPADANNITHDLINIFDTFVCDWCVEGATVPTDAEDKILNSIIFSAIWAVGGKADEHSRAAFNVFFIEMCNGEDVIEKYKIDLPMAGLTAHEIRKIPHRMGDMKNLFDWFFERDTCQWTPWSKTVSPFDVPVSSPYSEMIVPTIDSIRIKCIFNRLVAN